MINLHVAPQDTMQELYPPMLPIFDMAMARQFEKLKLGKVQVSMHLAVNSDALSFIMDADDVRAVLACNGDWSSVSGNIGRPAS